MNKLTAFLPWLFLSAFHCSLLLGCQSSQQAEPLFPEAEGQGFDAELLAEAYSVAGQIEGMRSLLVARNDVLVAERYYNGHSQSSLHNVQSVTKSVMSALIGIAIDRGYIESVDLPISRYLEPLVDSLDAEKGKITIRQLLTMTTGLEWQGLGGANEFMRWASAPDQIDYVLDKPLVEPPGTRFNYSDGAAHLLSIILTEATGQSTLQFAQRYLFAPLGIDSRQWPVDNRGYNIGAAGLALTSRDMLRFGMLYLDEGADSGRAIIPPEWVTVSTSARVSTHEAIPYGSHYGYLWWSGRAQAGDFYFAMGYGGQFILSLPDLGVVVVATCEWRYPVQQANRHWSDIINLIVNKVLPAVRN
jgi:CubicO group peptidase (beta-lactamase class C family)